MIGSRRVGDAAFDGHEMVRVKDVIDPASEVEYLRRPAPGGVRIRGHGDGRETICPMPLAKTRHARGVRRMYKSLAH